MSNSLSLYVGSLLRQSVKPMLSFELSVIDLVLAVAIVIVLLLQITRAPVKSVTEPELTNENQKASESSVRNVLTPRTSKTKQPFTRLIENSVKCPQHFGYLRNLSNTSSIPEECYSCPRMMQCLYSKKQNHESKT